MVYPPDSTTVCSRLPRHLMWQYFFRGFNINIYPLRYIRNMDHMNSEAVPYNEAVNALHTFVHYCKLNSLPLHTEQDIITCSQKACTTSGGDKACDAFHTLYPDMDLRQRPTMHRVKKQ